MTSSRGLRLALPILFIVPLVWLMVGCVYLPWFEQAKLTGTRQDFRRMPFATEGHADIEPPVTRLDVARLLGEPAYRSRNDRVWAYTLSTQHGIWVEPLCYHVTAGGQYLYALGLRFDESGTLDHHKLVTIDVPSQIGVYNFAMPIDGVEPALDEIDNDNGVPKPDAVRHAMWKNGEIVSTLPKAALDRLPFAVSTVTRAMQLEFLRQAHESEPGGALDR